MVLAAFFAGLFGLDGHGGVRHNHQALFWDELAGGLADAVGAVLDTDKGGAQVADELLLAGGQFLILLFQQYVAALLEGLEGGGGVGGLVLVAGNSLLDSLASLLTVNSYLFLVSMGLFLMRAQLLDFYRHLSKTGRLVCAAASVTALVFLAIYINFALRPKRNRAVHKICTAPKSKTLLNEHYPLI